MIMHPLEQLKLHCAYHNRHSLCNACREILFDQSIIIHDTFNYGSGKITRQGYFYHAESQTIRMKKLPSPATLIGDESWNLVPKSKVPELLNHEPSDKFNCDSFLERMEELYTDEIGSIERAEAVNWRQVRKHKKLW